MWSEIRIDIGNNLLEKKEIPEKFCGYGGRSFIVKYIMDLVENGQMDPGCDPLGPDNPLIFCNGVFAGTAASTDHRLSVGGKSPLTGGIKESSAGGTIAKYMADHGLRAITVHGIPEKDDIRYIHIKPDGEVVLENAQEYKFMGNYEFGDKMREKYGKDVAVASIGPAGVRKMRAASIQVTEFGEGYPSRAAGRGGMGALMGAKGLKALVIEKAAVRYKVEYADEQLFKQSVTELNKFMYEKGKDSHYHRVGTISIIDSTAANGILPVENFSGKMMTDIPEYLGTVPFFHNNEVRGGCNGKPCQAGCLVQCSNVYHDEKGNYLTSGLEYETVAQFGPNCRIKDLDKIATLDRMCDDIGVDTIEMGDAAGVAMDAGYIEWGDADAVISIMEDVRNGKDFGLTFGNGCEAVGLALGCRRIPVVKHQSLSGYDPRGTKGTGVTYATSPMGADHTAATTIGFTAYGNSSKADAVEVSRKLQLTFVFCDSMMCLFAFKLISSRMDLLLALYVGLYGGDMDMERITKVLGEDILRGERTFNRLAGLTREDDRLPEFFRKEPHKLTGEVFDVNEEELDSVFQF